MNLLKSADQAAPPPLVPTGSVAECVEAQATGALTPAGGLAMCGPDDQLAVVPSRALEGAPDQGSLPRYLLLGYQQRRGRVGAEHAGLTTHDAWGAVEI